MDWKILQSRITGQVVSADSPDFVAIREAMVWNKIKPARSPDVIVKVKNDNDIIEAVKFARINGLKIVVHGGGHSWCGLSVRNGGMIIDLSQLNDVKIDKALKKAVIQPVISNRELAHRLGEHDLAFPIGHCPTVKASGYLLNGGMSWNMSQWGPAVLSVEAIEFVTAEGIQLKASAEEHPDLFWAARGCGPGMFAVATKFHLNCFLLPKAIMTSSYYYSLDDLESVVEEVTKLGWMMPEFVELSIFLMNAPAELTEKCNHRNGKLCMITAVAFANTKEEGITALKILEKGELVTKCLSKSINEPTNFESLAEISGATWPEHHRNLCENQCSKAKPVDILMALREKIVEAPSTKSVIVFCQSTGQHNLLRPYAEIALSLDAQSYGGIWTIWENAADDDANYNWHNACTDILKKYTDRPYIGETDIVQDNSRVQKSFSSEKWKRLEQIRAKYDPEGVFFGYLGGLSTL